MVSNSNSTRRKFLEVSAHSFFWMLWFWLTYNLLAQELLGIQLPKMVFLQEGEEFQSGNHSENMQIGTSAIMVLLSIGALVKLIGFYISDLWLTKKYFHKGSYALFIFLFIAIMVSSILIEYGLSQLYIDSRNIFNTPERVSWNITNEKIDLNQYFLTAWSEINIGHYLILIVIFFNYTLYKNWSQSEQRQQQKEKEILQAQLSFLKSQISPHFLFNCMNSLFSMAQEQHANELAGSIANLSGLMRYMLYESNSQFVELQKEVKYIEQYLKLEALRYSPDAVDVTMGIIGNNLGFKITPLLLIPFVENAFKHGTKGVADPFIHIEICVEDRALNFQIRNKYLPKENINDVDSVSGIGLTNVKARLQLQYPGLHTLFISDTNSLFQVKLTLARKE